MPDVPAGQTKPEVAKITSEPQSAAAAGNEDRSGTGHYLSRFPARAVGDLSALARCPRPASSPRRPELQWEPGLTILLPRPDQLEPSRGEHGESKHRHCQTALTVAELSVVLSAAACAWPDPGQAGSLELELLALQIQSVAPACYRYQPVRHALLPGVEAHRQHHAGDPPVPGAAVILTITSPAITSRSTSADDLGVSSFAVAAHLAVSLVTHATITAATGLGLVSHSCLSQRGLGYRVGICRPTGRGSL